MPNDNEPGRSWTFNSDDDNVTEISQQPKKKKRSPITGQALKQAAGVGSVINPNHQGSTYNRPVENIVIKKEESGK